MIYWITADHHFGHANIIKYTSRPYKNLGSMNYNLIRRWNERVKPDDLIFYNGDFCFKNSSVMESKGEGINISSQYWREKLNGKIIFIKGNHDKNNSTKTCIENIELFFGNNRIFLTHRAKNYNPEIQFNLVAHCHDKWKIRKIWSYKIKKWCYLLNVGIDQWNYYPIKLIEAIGYIRKRINQERDAIKEISIISHDNLIYDKE